MRGKYKTFLNRIDLLKDELFQNILAFAMLPLDNYIETGLIFWNWTNNFISEYIWSDAPKSIIHSSLFFTT